MKMHIYSVFDVKTGVFSQPQIMLNRGSALRSFEEVANDPNSSLCKYAADFTMFELGTWDDETGVIQMHEAKISLGTALEFKRRDMPTNVTAIQQPTHEVQQ